MDYYYDYLIVKGAMKNDDYPYTASQSGNCYYNSSKIVGKVESYYQFSP